MDKLIISGLLVTSLNRIQNKQGDIFHALKKSDPGFVGFSEAYFSTIHYGEIKSWKKHLRMTLNIIVPIGEIKFVFFDDRDKSPTKDEFFEIHLSIDNYYRISVPPNVWMAFQGISKGTSYLLNIADYVHDPNEIRRLELEEILYNW